MIYCGAIAADDSEIRDFIMEKYSETNSERQKTLLLNALACDTEESEILKYSQSFYKFYATLFL